MPATKTSPTKRTKKAPAKAKVSVAGVKKLSKKKAGEGAFAVIETGGKQYQVREGESITIEKLTGTYKEGAAVVFDKVLLVDNGKDTQIGDPYLKGAKVEGALEQEGKGKKIRVLRYRAKSRHLRQVGHRQLFMKVRIVAIK